MSFVGLSQYFIVNKLDSASTINIHFKLPPVTYIPDYSLLD